MSYERGYPVCFLVRGHDSNDMKHVINNTSEPGTVPLINSLSLESSKSKNTLCFCCNHRLVNLQQLVSYFVFSYD